MIYNAYMMTYIFLGIIGLFVGGLLNVLADDLPMRRRPQTPRCPNCGHAHKVSAWMGVTRLLVQRECPQCELEVRPRALYTELGTAVGFALLPLLLPDPLDLAIGAFYLAVLILVIVIDVEHRLILHVVTFPTTLLAIGLSTLTSWNSPLMALAGAGVGFLIFYVLYWIGQIAYGPGALGFGDVTLCMTMGAMLGFPSVIFAIVFGILIGGVVSGALIGVGVLTRSSRIAYGPFLAVGGMIMLVWGPQIVAWYTGALA